MRNYHLSDLIDIEALQSMADSLYQSTGMPIGIIDAIDNSILVGAGWQAICTKFHRKNPGTLIRCQESDNYIKNQLKIGEACKYKCKNGLWDIGIPIVVSDQHLATMFIGQFFYENEIPDRSFFIDQGQKFGFDLDAYLNALDQVPHFTSETIEYLLSYNKSFIGFITNLAEGALSRKQAEEQLWEQNQIMQGVLSHTHMMAAYFDRQFNFIWANRAYADTFKKTPSFFKGKNYFELYPHEENQAIFQTVVDKGEPFFIEEKPFEFPDQPERGVTYGDWSLIPVKNESNKVVGLVFTLADVTRRVKAEEGTRQNEKKFRTLIENTIDWVWQVDNEGIYTYVSPQAEQLLGFKTNEIIGKTPFDFMPAGEADRVKKMFIQISSRHGKIVGLEDWMVAKDGKEILFETNATPLFNEQDNFIGYMGTCRDISERKANEQALSNSEQRLAIATRSANIGIWDLDIENNWQTWDDKMFDLYHVDHASGAYGVDMWGQWLHPEDREFAFQTYQAALQGDADFDLEFRILCPNGAVRWIKGDGIVIRDKAGKPIRMLGTNYDITERKQAEEALRESEALYREIANNIPGMVYVLERDNQTGSLSFSFMSEGAQDLLGIPAGDFMNDAQLLMKRIPSEELVRVKDLATHSRETMTPYTHVHPIRHADGRTLWVGTQAIPHRRAGGSVYWNGVVVDVTDLQEAQRNLKTSEERFRGVFETSPTGIAIIDHVTQRFLQANESFLSILGYSEEELLALTVADVTHPDDWERKKQLVDPYQDDKQNVFTIEKRYIRKDGAVRNVRVSGGMLDLGDDTRLALANVEDITEQKQSEERIRQMQKMESIGSLAGGIAHDFNNILFPIIGMSELMMEDLEPDSLAYENAQEIYRAGKRAKDLVNQILSFGHQTEHEMMPVKFQKVLKEVLKLCRSTIPTNIEIEQDIQQDCGSIRGNTTQLHQIGMNLITNAYHAVQHKNGKISVNFKEIELGVDDLSAYSLKPGKYALLSVSDNGVGMSDELSNKIFEPYFTTKEKGKGTGLGLAVVYGIVRKFRGNIKVYSELGSGSTFNVYLPLMEKNINRETESVKQDIQRGDEHILLVDDEPPVARLEKLMLERLGYTVSLRVSSIEALEAFRDKPDKFDLIVSDMSMPNMTGDQLAYEIRKIKPKIPIIICTGFSERINKNKAEEIGVNGFLMKPIIKSDMARMVRC